jgi:hypothetical protein
MKTPREAFTHLRGSVGQAIVFQPVYSERHTQTTKNDRLRHNGFRLTC